MRYAIWMLATLSLGMNAIGGAADPFRSGHLVTMCTSVAMEEPIEPLGAAGPIVRCDVQHAERSAPFRASRLART